jgi:hypothetical protein
VIKSGAQMVRLSKVSFSSLFVSWCLVRPFFLLFTNLGTCWSTISSILRLNSFSQTSLKQKILCKCVLNWNNSQAKNLSAEKNLLTWHTDVLLKSRNHFLAFPVMNHFLLKKLIFPDKDTLLSSKGFISQVETVEIYKYYVFPITTEGGQRR